MGERKKQCPNRCLKTTTKNWEFYHRDMVYADAFKTANRKLIVAVKKGAFLQYIRGERLWVTRSISSKLNEERVFPGRTIELRLGLSGASIYGMVSDVYVFESIESMWGRLDYQEIVPRASSITEALSQLRRQLEPGERVIAFRVNLELPDYRNKFIITGGPGFGKTAVLSGLEKAGCTIYHEAARDIIEEQENSDDPILPWRDRIRFDREVVKRMKVDYDAHDPSHYGFYDRGFPDLIGWRRYSELGVKDIVNWVYTHPYERLVFFVQPWREIYESNEQRPYSFSESACINDILASCYCRLGYEIEYLPNEDVQRRVDFVFSKILDSRKSRT